MIGMRLYFPFTRSPGQSAELPSATSHWRTFSPAQPTPPCNSRLGGGYQQLLDWQRKSKDSDSHRSSGEQHCCSLPPGSASVRKHSLRNADRGRDHARHIPAMPALGTSGPTCALLRRSEQTSPTHYRMRWLQEPEHLPTPLLLAEAMTKLRASQNRAEMLRSKGSRHDSTKAEFTSV